MPKATDPAGRCGVYASLDAVPEEYRLASYAVEYEGRDVWATFRDDHLFLQHDSERFRETARRAGTHWRDHMETRERHHALATPADAEAWATALLDGRAVSTAYNQYWVRIERFYTWLQRRRAHPHLYHPLRMAAVDGDATQQIWAEKIARGRDEVDADA